MSEPVQTDTGCKSRRNLILTVLAMISLISGILLYYSATRYWLPEYLEREVASVVAAEFNIPASALKITAADLSGAAITIEKNSAPWLETLNVSSIKVRYKLTNLLLNREVRIQMVELDGLRLRFSVDTDGIKLNGENFKQLLDEFNRINQSNSAAGKKSLRLKISDSIIEVKTGGGQKTLLLPFAMGITWHNEPAVIQADLNINWQQRLHNFNSLIDLARHEAEIKFNSTFPLENIQQFIETMRMVGVPGKFRVTGNGSYSGQLLLDYASGQIKSIEIDGHFEQDGVVYGNIALGSYKDAPLDLRVVKAGEIYQLTVNGAYITAPVLLSLEQINCEIYPSADKINLNCGVKLLPENIVCPVAGKLLIGKLPFQDSRFSATMQLNSKRWECSLKQLPVTSPSGKEETRQLLLKYGEYLLNGYMDKFELSGRGENLTGEISAEAVTSEVSCVWNGRILNLPKLEINSLNKFNLAEEITAMSTFFSIKTGKVSLSGVTENVCFDNINATGKYYQNSTGNRLSMTLNSTKATASCGPDGGSMEKLNLAADISSQTGANNYDARLEFSAAQFELYNLSSRLNVNDIKTRITVNLDTDKSGGISFHDLGGRFNAQRLNYAANNLKINLLQPGVNIKTDFSGNLSGSNHIIKAEAEQIKIENNKNTAETWNAKLESVYQPAATGKRILRTKAEFGKTNIENELFKIVAASGNFALNSDFKPGRTTPDVATSQAHLNSLWVQYGDTKIRAAEFNLRNKYTLDSHQGNGAVLAKIDGDFDAAAIHGEINRLFFDCPSMTGDTELQYSPDSSLRPVAGSGKLTCKSVTGNLDQNEFCIDLIKLNWNEKSDDDGNVLLSHVLKGTAVAIKTNLMTADFPLLTISGQSINMETFAGHARATEGIVEIPDYDISFSGIELKIPIALPDMRAAGNGEIKSAKICISKQDAGSAGGELEFSDTGLIFQLNHNSKAVPGMTMSSLGQIFFPLEPFKMELDFNIPEFYLNKELQLQKIFTTIPEPITLQGTFACRGSVKIDGGAATGNMDYSCRNAAISRGKLQMQNVSCSGAIEDIFNWRSAPHQNVKFNKLKFMQYELNNGMFNVELERPGEWMIENCQFDTLGGTWNSITPFRYIEEQGGEATLLCRGAALGDFLRFYGINSAGTTGKIDGTVTVDMKSERATIDNFRLYSLPGESGVLKIPSPEQYRMNSAAKEISSNQTAFEQALNGLNYQWLKLDSTPEHGREIIINARNSVNDDNSIISGKLLPKTDGMQ